VFAAVFALLCLAGWGVLALHSAWGWVVLGALALIFLAGLILWGSVACSVWLGRRMPLAEFAMQRFVKMFRLIAWACDLAGVSRDRLGSSLIAVSNELVRCTVSHIRNNRLLCLAPRCLDRETFARIRELTQEHGCDFYIASHGFQARQRVTDTRPGAIIAIACERDLVTGIRDAGDHIPVLAIPNKRPAGPCKGASIDIADLRGAIEFFKGRAVEDQ